MGIGFFSHPKTRQEHYPDKGNFLTKYAGMVESNAGVMIYLPGTLNKHLFNGCWVKYKRLERQRNLRGFFGPRFHNFIPCQD